MKPLNVFQFHCIKFHVLLEDNQAYLSDSYHLTKMLGHQWVHRIHQIISKAKKVYDPQIGNRNVSGEQVETTVS